MTNEASDTPPKRNWLLIGVGIGAALLLLVSVFGAVAMYIANFNLLDWME